MPSSKTRSTIGHLVLTTELKRKLAAVQSLKADVSSVSPSSVRLKELWVVCGFICRKWSYPIGGNMATTLFPTSRHFGKPQNTSTKMYLPNGRSIPTVSVSAFHPNKHQILFTFGGEFM